MASDPGHRRALVTGATGYVGRHLARYLVNGGWKVSIVVRPKSDLLCLADVRDVIEVQVHDGTSAGMIDVVTNSRPDTVFHLASLFIAQHRSEDIAALVTSNVLFGTQLIEAMSIAGCTQLINVGTSWQHFAGADYNPVNLYAATKQAFDDILRYYLEATPLKAITLSFFDSYGPDDSRRKLIWLLRDAALKGTRLHMSPGEQCIDLVYIDDVVTACLRAAELLRTQNSSHAHYGVSSGAVVSLRHLVAMIERATGKTLCIDWGGRPYRPREVMVPFCPHPPLPGWAPSISLDQGIARVMLEHSR